MNITNIKLHQYPILLFLLIFTTNALPAQSILESEKVDSSQISETEMEYVQNLTNQLRSLVETENLDNCNQRCRACKQQARYRLASCLRSASNETQRAQCRQNYQDRVAHCDNKSNMAEKAENVSEVALSQQDKLLVDIIWMDINNWGLYPNHDYVGCGPGITPLLGRYPTRESCRKAGKRRYRNSNSSWCCKEI